MASFDTIFLSLSRQILAFQLPGGIRRRIFPSPEVEQSGDNAGDDEHQIAAHRPAEDHSRSDQPRADTAANPRRNTFSAAPAAPGSGR